MRSSLVLLVGVAALVVVVLTGGCPGKPPATEVVVKPGDAKAPAPPAKTGVSGGVTVIGRGQEVKLEDHLVAGKTTVFDFFSEQCPACVALAPELEQLAAKRSDLAIVKVDVNRPEVTDRIDWESPVARQHKLESLPHLVIFDATGHKTAEGEDAYQQVARWLEGK